MRVNVTVEVGVDIDSEHLDGYQAQEEARRIVKELLSVDGRVMLITERQKEVLFEA